MQSQSIHKARRRKGDSVALASLAIVACVTVRCATAQAVPTEEVPADSLVRLATRARLFQMFGDSQEKTGPVNDLEEMSLPCGIKVWRKKVDPHGPVFTVGFDGQRYFRLGGFEAPEVYAFS